MTRKYCLIILNRYPAYAKNIISSINDTHSIIPEICVVCDRHKEILPNCKQIYTTDEFIYARNANRGINAFPDRDIVLLNDDTTCVLKDFFDELHYAAYEHEKCGLIAPMIDGGVGNILQQYPPIHEWRHLPDIIGCEMTVCFPCVYIKRETIDKVGLLDEDYVHYGFDDDDYCDRVREAGLMTMITSRIHIKHGEGGNKLYRGKNWSCSFATQGHYQNNQQIYEQKKSARKI